MFQEQQGNQWLHGMSEWENGRRCGQWGWWNIGPCRSFQDIVRALAFTVVGWELSKAFYLTYVVLP